MNTAPDLVRHLLLVRHGLPDYRVRQRGDEVPGPPLSVVGRDQARQAAAVVRQYQPARVHSSPLTRTLQTAQVIAGEIGAPLSMGAELREWHRTERLHDVSMRMARWLVQWLHGDEACAAVVSHASPLLGILRSALYLPHVAWHRTGRPDLLVVDSCDQFEVSMGSVFEIVFEPAVVTARRLFHPRPKLLYVYRGRKLTGLPRIVCGTPERVEIQRPNRLALLGYRACSGRR